MSTLLCDNTTKKGCFINNLQENTYDVKQCISGNTSNGKGLHQTFNSDIFNPRTFSAIEGVVVKTDKTNDVDKYENKLGKFDSTLLPSNTFNLNTEELLNVNIAKFASSFDDNTTIAYWIKHGYYDKDNNVYKDIISAADPATRPAALYTSSQCPQRLDYVMPWTDNLALAIHMQNALYEYYINDSKQLGLSINDRDNPHGAVTYANTDTNTIEIAFCSDYWWGWNEIPVIGREYIDDKTVNRKIELTDGQSMISTGEVRTKHWSFNTNGYDYTLAVYIQDDSLFDALETIRNDNNSSTIDEFKSKMTTQQNALKKAWINDGGASNSMQFSYNNYIPTDDPSSTSTILTNFSECFKDSSGNPNKNWQNISSTIQQYFTNRFLTTLFFRSCSLVFFRQRIVFPKDSDTPYFQKEFFDLDPVTIPSIGIGNLSDGRPINFTWQKNPQGFWAYTFNNTLKSEQTIYD